MFSCMRLYALGHCLFVSGKCLRIPVESSIATFVRGHFCQTSFCQRPSNVQTFQIKAPLLWHISFQLSNFYSHPFTHRSRIVHSFHFLVWNGKSSGRFAADNTTAEFAAKALETPGVAAEISKAPVTFQLPTFVHVFDLYECGLEQKG